MSWILAAGMAIDGMFWKAHWFGAFAMFSAMQATFILSMWSWKETRPVRTKQWWALLFFADLWGSLIGMWLRYEDHSSLASLTAVTWISIASLHLVLSVLVWRDHLIPSDEGQSVTHS